MLSRKKERLLFLSECNGLGIKTLSRMIREDSTLEKVFQMSNHQLKTQYLLSESTLIQIKDKTEQEKFLKKSQKYKGSNIEVITIFDTEYPSLLKEIFDPPLVLYVKGDTSLLYGGKILSVVGTRDASINGLRSLEKIITPMIEQGWTIVSGLAYGIDISAHRITMTSNGRTIAVLGSGFNHIYPREHADDAQRIASEHLLISEFPPDRKPAKWQFPMRNRIISGLSRGTLIVEAREKSGSLITGDQALQQGREVFAVPGSILEPRTMGTHHLIQQGAKLAASAEDIFEELSDFKS